VRRVGKREGEECEMGMNVRREECEKGGDVRRVKI